MGFYAEHSTKKFTSGKMKEMGKASSIGSPPGNSDESDRDEADRYGKTAAKSDSSEFKKGGAVKKPHMGRMGRATGGRVGRAKGGKVDEVEAEGTLDTTKKTDPGFIRDGEQPQIRFEGRDKRASGGKTGKGKTVVNVIVGSGKGGQQQAPPQAMPPPMPPPQPPPQRPPMPPPQASGPPMMPPGGAPMGPAGAPPPGVPPQMRKSGGRVGNLGKYAHPPKAGFSDEKAPHRGGGKEGFSDTKPTSKRDPLEKAGAGSGLGRIEKTRREA
jgi:hypothetical protein